MLCAPPTSKRRLGRARASKATNHPTTIVRLVSRQKRNEIYANRFKAKDIEGFSVDDVEKLFISESFTQKMLKIVLEYKAKRQELGFQFFYP